MVEKKSEVIPVLHVKKDLIEAADLLDISHLSPITDEDLSPVKGYLVHLKEFVNLGSELVQRDGQLPEA